MPDPEKGGGHRWRAAPKISLLLLGGIALALAVGELAVRLLGLDPLADEAAVRSADHLWPECIRVDPEVGFELNPNVCGTNSQGLLGDEPPDEIPADALRVAVLGDSIAADRMFVDFLEELLAERLGRPVLTDNYGTGGYSITNELAVLRHKVLATKPDVVVLQFCLNDYLVTPVLARLGDRIVALNTADELSVRAVKLFQVSALCRFVMARIAMISLQAYHIPFETRRAHVSDALEEMDRLTRAVGAELLVLIFPHLKPLRECHGNERDAYEHVRSKTAAAGIPAIDLTPLFHAGGIERLRFGGEDELLGSLPESLAAFDLPEHLQGWLRSKSRETLHLDEATITGHVDLVHPNFLGHLIAAWAATTHLAERLDKGPQDPPEPSRRP